VSGCGPTEPFVESHKNAVARALLRPDQRCRELNCGGCPQRKLPEKMRGKGARGLDGLYFNPGATDSFTAHVCPIALGSRRDSFTTDEFKVAGRVYRSSPPD
jgi:hypothetical protein